MVATILTIVVCFLLVGVFHLGDEAAVGVFALAATLVGTIFIPVEIKNSQEVTCCQMLIDQNNYFHDNEHLMKVYQALERPQGAPGVWDEVEDTDIACYCTFFENLYLLYSHKIARIEDLDDLFGYRFFIFTNDSYVQEHHLLPTSSSYNEIFRLYEAWIRHRRKTGSPIPKAENAFSEEYLSGRLYMNDAARVPEAAVGSFEEKSTAFGIRTLGFDSVSPVLNLQARACEQIADKSVFYPLSRAELIESIYMDTVLGVFAPDGSLAGFAVLVNGRVSSRNLASDAGEQPGDVLTFDVVVTDPKWRGFGIQKHLTDCAVSLARSSGRKLILATVSPGNSFSLNNFLSKGFSVSKEGLRKYDSLERSLLSLDL